MFSQRHILCVQLAYIVPERTNKEIEESECRLTERVEQSLSVNQRDNWKVFTLIKKL